MSNQSALNNVQINVPHILITHYYTFLLYILHKVSLDTLLSSSALI